MRPWPTRRPGGGTPPPCTVRPHSGPPPLEGGGRHGGAPGGDDAGNDGPVHGAGGDPPAPGNSTGFPPTGARPRTRPGDHAPGRWWAVLPRSRDLPFPAPCGDSGEVVPPGAPPKRGASPRGRPLAGHPVGGAPGGARAEPARPRGAGPGHGVVAGLALPEGGSCLGARVRIPARVRCAGAPRPRMQLRMHRRRATRGPNGGGAQWTSGVFRG